MIECKKVEKIYTSGGTVIHALDGFNVHINSGEFCIIMGPSGSGKSTLLSSIIGLIKVDRGNILINTQEITSMSENKLATLRQNDIGFIFQFYNLHEGLTAQENVELPLLISGKENVKTRRKLAKDYLELVGLKGKENKYFYELSGGEQQRVGIARALIHDPQIILADEPTGDLDSDKAQEIIDILLNLKKQGKTVVIVTHDISLLQEGMRVIQLRDGKLVKDFNITEDSLNEFKMDDEARINGILE